MIFQENTIGTFDISFQVLQYGILQLYCKWAADFLYYKYWISYNWQFCQNKSVPSTLLQDVFVLYLILLPNQYKIFTNFRLMLHTKYGNVTLKFCKNRSHVRQVNSLHVTLLPCYLVQANWMAPVIKVITTQKLWHIKILTDA